MAWYYLYRRFVLLCLIVTGSIIYYDVFRGTQRKAMKSFPPHERNLKKILYWIKYFKHPDFNFGSGQATFINAKCPESRCTATSLRDTGTPVDDFDAILFHGDNFPSNDLPESRRPHQRYVFYLKKSPGNIVDNLDMAPPGFFNWTMTYRLDSDILLVDGSFRTLTQPYEHLLPPIKTWQRIPKNFTSADLTSIVRNTIAKKTKLVAWFVSKCKTLSRREAYVKELGKHIAVDIFGKCGNLTCLPVRSDECYRKMESSYKFYLAFENSICLDYVSEKLFDVMRYYVVPVVYGGANYSEIAPPGSYINAQDFASPRDLARYLLHLDSHPEEYARFFWWKHHYKTFQHQHFCQLCEMLHRENQQAKSYNDIREWYQPLGVCRDY